MSMVGLDMGEEFIDTSYWVTREGHIVKMTDLSSRHLRNILQMLERNAKLIAFDLNVRDWHQYLSDRYNTLKEEVERRDNVDMKIIRFEDAVKQVAWRGAQDPEDWDIIDKEYNESLDDLRKTLYGKAKDDQADVELRSTKKHRSRTKARSRRKKSRRVPDCGDE